VCVAQQILKYPHHPHHPHPYCLFSGAGKESISPPERSEVSRAAGCFCGGGVFPGLPSPGLCGEGLTAGRGVNGASAVIEPGEAAELLASDLRRVADKAREGRPLTISERRLLAEAAEVGDAGAENEGGEGGEGAAAGGATNDGRGLAPGLAPAIEWRSLAEAAEGYGYSLRQVKNWKRDGVAAGDPAPIGDPAEMPGWYERVYAPRVAPDRLREAAYQLAAQAKERGGGDAGERARAPEAVPLVAEQELGLLAMLDRLRKAEATLHAQYMRAVETQDRNSAAFYQKEWGASVERLRAAEKAAPAALEAQGIYIRRADVRRELVPIHQAIAKGTRSALKRARLKLAAAVGDSSAWGVAVDEVLDEVFGQMAEADFAPILELEAS